MPITPKTGSLFHAETHPDGRVSERCCEYSKVGHGIMASGAHKRNLGDLLSEVPDDLTAMEAAAEAWLIDALARPNDAVRINHPAARRSRPKGAGVR